MTRLTASSLHRADACIGSAVLPAIPEAGEWAEMGNIADRFVREAKTGDRAKALAAVPAEWKSMMAALPLEKIPDGCDYQSAFAYNVLTGEVRRIASRGEGYPDMSSEWMFGSTDIAGLRQGRGMVWDLKLGAYTIGREPSTDLQLGFYALCIARLCKVDEVEVGFLRADWKGDLHPDVCVLDEWALDGIEERVRGIWRAQQAASDAPPLHVGEHCTYCPARRSCPAQTQPVALALAGRIDELAAAELPALDVLRERIGALTLVDKGRLYERLDAAMDYLALAKGILRDDARSEPLPLSGGKELREVQWGSSQKSDVAKAELAALTEQLVERGEIKTVKVAQVRPMKART